MIKRFAYHLESGATGQAFRHKFSLNESKLMPNSGENPLIFASEDISLGTRRRLNFERK